VRVCCKQVLFEDVTRQGQRPQPVQEPCQGNLVRSEIGRSTGFENVDSIFVAAGRMNNRLKATIRCLTRQDPDMQLAIEVPRVVFKASSASAWLKKQV
jgi:hypothetical protein